jgi:hypothetical protein
MCTRATRSRKHTHARWSAATHGQRRRANRLAGAHHRAANRMPLRLRHERLYFLCWRRRENALLQVQALVATPINIGVGDVAPGAQPEESSDSLVPPPIFGRRPLGSVGGGAGDDASAARDGNGTRTRVWIERHRSHEAHGGVHKVGGRRAYRNRAHEHPLHTGEPLRRWLGQGGAPTLRRWLGGLRQWGRSRPRLGRLRRSLEREATKVFEGWRRTRRYVGYPAHRWQLGGGRPMAVARRLRRAEQRRSRLRAHRAAIGCGRRVRGAHGGRTAARRTRRNRQRRSFEV